MPSNAATTFYTSLSQFSTTATDQTLSNFYFQMSQHNSKPFKLLAVNFPTRVNVTATTAINQGYSWGQYSSMVIDRIRTDYQTELQTVLNQGLDSRTNGPGYNSDNSTSAPDGKVDYTVIIWRYYGGSPAGTFDLQYASGSGGGFAAVPYGAQLIAAGTTPSLTLADGFTQCMGSGGMDKAIFTHELAHTLYNAPHTYGANGVVGKHLYGSVGYGMIGGPMLNCANGWERWYMNWIPLKANGVNANVSTPPSLAPGGLYTLRDFITTGDVVRIRLPNSQAADGTYNYLWLENHQGASVWDNAAWLLDGQNPAQPFLAPPRGLVAYVEDLHVTQTEPDSPGTSFNDGAGGLRILPAGGLFDADHDGNTSTFNNHFWGALVYNFINRQTNATGSASRQSGPIDDRNGDRIIDHAEYTNGRNIYDPHDRNEGFGFLSYDGAGPDGLLGFDMAFDRVGQKLGLDRKTAIFPSLLFNPATQQLSATKLSGVSVEIVSISGGNITVRVRLNDVDMVQSTRWTGNVELNPVTNSTYAAILNAPAVLTIEPSGTPNRTTPIGSTGTKADFVNPSRLTIRTGTRMLVKDLSSVVLRGHSTLYVEDDGALEAEDKATIEVEEGSLVSVKTRPEADALQSNNQLKLLPGGMLEIRDEGIIIAGRAAIPVKVQVYPNPATALHFAVPEAGPQTSYRYRVLNAYGQAVRTAQGTGAELKAGVTLTALPTGPYLLEVQQADGTGRAVKRVEVR